MAVKTATNNRRKPSFFLLGPKHQLKKSQLHTIDALLLMAYQILQDETCKKCGTHSWHGRTTDSRVQMEMQETTCYGCKKQEKDEDTKSKNKGKAYGVQRYVVPKMMEFNEEGMSVLTDNLPGREEYHELLHKKHIEAEIKKAAAAKEAMEDQ